MSIRHIGGGLLALLLGVSAACSSNQSPDQIRENTAKATETLKRDTKAVAEGVKEGLTRDKDGDRAKAAIDINKASKSDLSSLPGITSEKADRIIAERPYAATHQLVSRNVLSAGEYSRVQDRVVVTR